MKTFIGTNYYEVGDLVVQDAYPGCPAVIVEVVDEDFRGGRTILYRVQIDAEGHPEAQDENGEPECIKYSLMTRETIDRLFYEERRNEN